MAKEIKETSEVAIRCPECNIEERWPLEAFKLRRRFMGADTASTLYITSAFLEIPDVYCLKCHICCEVLVKEVIYD